MAVLSPLRALQRRAVVLVSCLFPLWAGALTLPVTAEADPTVPSVHLRGYRFHAQAFGEVGRPVVVVLHGGPGADHRYLLGLAALADHFRVVFYDQRGTGLSPRVPAADITPQGFVDDLDAIVDAYGAGQPVHLVGHSWGAMLASAYAGAHPGKVGRLVLAEPGFLDGSTLPHLNAGGWPGWPVAWGMARAWLAQWSVDTRGDPQARRDYLLGRMLPLVQARATCDGRPPVLEGWRAGWTNFDATVGRMGRDPAFAASLDFRRGVERFEGATLFLAGRCSPVMGETQQRRHLGHFRHARLDVLEGAGHFLFNDQPERSVALVRAFLAGP